MAPGPFSPRAPFPRIAARIYAAKVYPEWQAYTLTFLQKKHNTASNTFPEKKELFTVRQRRQTRPEQNADGGEAVACLSHAVSAPHPRLPPFLGALQGARGEKCQEAPHAVCCHEDCGDGDARPRGPQLDRPL